MRSRPPKFTGANATKEKAFLRDVKDSSDGVLQVEFKMRVKAEVEADDPGVFGGPPDGWQAPCPGGVEVYEAVVLSITTDDGRPLVGSHGYYVGSEFKLTEGERDYLEEELAIEAEEDHYAAYEDAIESYADSLRDERGY